MAIIAYGIYIITLIKNLKWELPDITHPWYANNAVALGMFARIETYFNSLTHQGPGCRYHPEPSKSVPIVHPWNIEARKLFSARQGALCTSKSVLVGLSQSEISEEYWLI